MKVCAIYFSPTGSTEKIVKVIANEFGDYQEFDLSKRETNVQQTFAQDELCVIGVPSYGGRVPSVVLERMNEYQGNNAKAVLVVSYGNRAYDDTLKELTEFVEKKGSAVWQQSQRLQNTPLCTSSQQDAQMNRIKKNWRSLRKRSWTK